MTSRFIPLKLRSTTALAVTFSLAASAGWAQQIMPSCTIDAPMVPCVADDQVIETEAQFREAQDSGEIAQAAQGEGTFYLVEDRLLGGTKVEMIDGAVAADLSPELKAQYDAAVAAQADPEAPVAGELLDIDEIEPMADEEAPEAAPAEGEEADVLDGGAEVTGEVDATVDPEANVEGEVSVDPEPQVEAGQDPNATPEPEVEAQQDPTVLPEVEAQQDPNAAPEAGNVTTEEVTPETEAEEAQTSAETEGDVEGETQTEGSVDGAVEADPAEDQGLFDAIEQELANQENADDAASVDGTVEGEAGTEGDPTLDGEVTGETEEVPEEVAPTPEETVEEAPAAAAANAETEGSADAEVTTEEVTDEDVRSADEDFDTAVNDDVSAQADDDDDGLSSFERALLLGLGAVAIGSILDNGDEVVSNSGDRIVVETESGELRVLKNDDVLLRQPGSQVQTEQFSDGSTRTTVTRDDGTKVVTIRANDGRVLRRALVQADGTQVELFDDTQAEQEVDVTTLPKQTAPAASVTNIATEEELRQALAANIDTQIDRTFSLRQVRNIKEVRELAPVIELDSITFETASAAIKPDQARELALLGTAIRDYIDRRPEAVFLVEGHTDAVGDASYNLALSDRRAETVALALTEYFDVPPANLITQGYGEAHLKVRTLQAEQANRRAVVRNITELLR
ncbi:OmpA family protein [Thalassorhabdomicrobium marinisediminis]|uniref:OmpA family protein n=1 Tax=Thalassorhabdomicrobium marinisediminis TaxID=2170577 RepID=UPI0024928948|nr:OmpA family protein [Thalassorhabdomicrobium marinisediminis]